MNHSFQWFQNHVCSFNSFLVFLSRIIVLLFNGIAATITGLAFLLAVCTCDHEAGTMRIQPLKLDFQMVLIMKNGGSSF
jgi:hypothetical protein